MKCQSTLCGNLPPHFTKKKKKYTREYITPVFFVCKQNSLEFIRPNGCVHFFARHCAKPKFLGNDHDGHTPFLRLSFGFHGNKHGKLPFDQLFFCSILPFGGHTRGVPPCQRCVPPPPDLDGLAGTGTPNSNPFCFTSSSF